MGRSIVYCDKCGQLLKEEVFLQGKAFTQDNRNYCAGCRPSSLTLPQAKKASSSRIPKQPSKESISSSRIPKQPSNESRRVPAVSPPPAPVPAAPVDDGAKARKVYLGAAGAIVALCLVIYVARGDKDKRPADVPDPVQAVVSVKPVPTENLSPENQRLEEAARAACVKAYGVPEKDLAGRWRAFESALAAARGTSYAPEAEGQLRKLRRAFEDERGSVETRTQDIVAREQYKAALDLWEGELKRYDVAEWTKAVQQRIVELKAEVDRRIGVMREAASDAKRRGDQAEIQRVRSRVVGWGMPGFAEIIDKTVAETLVVKPEPPPDGSANVPAIDVYRSRWKEIVGPAAFRDFAEAAKAMEKLAAESRDEAVKKEAADDLENLRLAAGLVQEAMTLLPKLAKGQKVALTWWDRTGTAVRHEETVLKIDAHRIEMKLAESSFVIPMGEVASASLADVFRTRPAKKESDARAAAVASLHEGDVEGAQRFRTEAIASINEKYADAAKEAAPRRASDEKEAAARRMFYEAERDYFDYGETGNAIGKYKALLAEHGGTAFVRRNRAAIAARTEGGMKDFLYLSADIGVTGNFKLGKYGKIEAAWVSQADLEAAKARENYLQLDFSATTEGEYRCWILAGGCCQEVFGCSYQGTELTAPDPANPREKVPAEPDGAVSAPVKPYLSSMKKLHSQHTGPKNPERFEWIQVGTFKYPTAGPKTIRILTNQKGFAVATAAVLATRPGPPREIELKEFERWRAETPGASLKQGGMATGTILWEAWKGCGNGGSVSDLVNHPAFKEDRPTDRNLIPLFEGPQEWAEEYGSRIRGYVHPPATGAYIFWIATDDQGELWLSTDEDPKNRQKIASVPEWTAAREYTKHSTQQSRPIELKAGRRYYIEALHKEGIGGDRMSVKWKLPSGTEEDPIPGHRLSPFAVPKK
jgi:tetratricopeptide (TPR) repeat protein